ncbi:MAG: TatD family hydrolase [Butyricimonas faecihominis]
MKGILHCFPGTEEDARQAIDLGFLLGIGGVVTFKKSSMAEVVEKTGGRPPCIRNGCPLSCPRSLSG